MARLLDLDLRKHVVAAVFVRQILLCRHRELRRQCRLRRQVDAALSEDWECGARLNGRARRCLLEGERSFLLGRLADEPDISMRALADLAARASSSATYSVWNLLRREDQTFRNKRARQRAGSACVARRRARWRRYQSRIARLARLHRRDLDQDQHGRRCAAGRDAGGSCHAGHWTTPNVPRRGASR